MDRVNELKKAIEEKVDAIKEVPTELKANTQWKHCLEASARNLAVGAFVGTAAALLLFSRKNFEYSVKLLLMLWQADPSCELLRLHLGLGSVWDEATRNVTNHFGLCGRRTYPTPSKSEVTFSTCHPQVGTPTVLY